MAEVWADQRSSKHSSTIERNGKGSRSIAAAASLLQNLKILGCVILIGCFLQRGHPQFYRFLPQVDLNNIPYLDLVGGAAVLPFTTTRSASQASLATVRRLIIRETFKYLSSLIGGLLTKEPVRWHRLHWFRIYFTASFSALPALKTGALLAAMVMGLRVLGLIPA